MSKSLLPGDTALRRGNASHTSRSHRHHHTCLQIICNDLPYQIILYIGSIIPNHTIYQHRHTCRYSHDFIYAVHRVQLRSTPRLLTMDWLDLGRIGPPGMCVHSRCTYSSVRIYFCVSMYVLSLCKVHFSFCRTRGGGY